MQRVRAEIEEQLPATLLRRADAQARARAGALGVGLAAVVVGPASLTHVPKHGREAVRAAREGKAASDPVCPDVGCPCGWDMVVLERRADEHEGLPIHAGAGAERVAKGMAMHAAP